MIHVEEHELDITFPSTTVSFVLMQPFVRFSQPIREPYRWADTEAPAQHDAIRRTLQLAIQDDNVPHFLVFPEYSIPGLAGVAIIGEMVRSDQWPSNTVVIAGVDGLTPDEYRTLTETNGDAVRVPHGRLAGRLLFLFAAVMTSGGLEEAGHDRPHHRARLRGESRQHQP
jgi:hypothetical protein